jgi:hypothetical protein
MSSVVNVGSWEISSNTEAAADMAEALKSDKDDAPKPEIKVDRGEEVDGADPETSAAAAKLGKKGGEAAAKARAAAEKKPAEKEAKADDGKTTEKPESKRGDPRRDPEARVREATSQLAEERRQRQAREQELAELRERLERVERGEHRRQPADDRPEAERRAAPDDDDPEPNEDDYDGSPGKTWQDYQREVRAWDRRQLKRELAAETEQVRDRETRASSFVEAVTTKVQAHERRMEEAVAADPTFMERVEQAQMSGWVPSYDPSMIGKDPNPQNIITDAIIESDNGHLLIGHIADSYISGDMGDVETIVNAGRAAMKEAFNLGYDMRDPREKAVVFERVRAAINREVGRLEGRLLAGQRQAAPRHEASRAKPPVRTVNASQHAGAPDLHADQDLDTFLSRVGEKERPRRW